MADSHVTKDDEAALALRLQNDRAEGFDGEEGVALLVGVVIDETNTSVDNAKALVTDTLEALTIQPVTNRPLVVPQPLAIQEYRAAHRERGARGSVEVMECHLATAFAISKLF